MTPPSNFYCIYTFILSIHLKFMGSLLELRFLKNQIKIKSRMLIAVTILVATSLSWSFFMLFAYENIFTTIIGEDPVYIGQAIFLAFGAISAIIGSFISERVNRRKFLWFWIILGAISSLSILVFSETDLIWFSSLFLWYLLGIGLSIVYSWF